ncbi:MAG TPA: hypothetical protein VGK99_05700 [Acidobacteriota bacterium]|jgi:hypothetical protein
MKERIPLSLAGKLSVVGLIVAAVGILPPLALQALPLGDPLSGPSLCWSWLALVMLVIL